MDDFLSMQLIKNMERINLNLEKRNELLEKMATFLMRDSNLVQVRRIDKNGNIMPVEIHTGQDLFGKNYCKDGGKPLSQIHVTPKVLSDEGSYF